MTELGPAAWPPAPIRTLRASETRNRAAFIELNASPEVGSYLSAPRPRDELKHGDRGDRKGQARYASGTHPPVTTTSNSLPILRPECPEEVTTREICRAAISFAKDGADGSAAFRVWSGFLLQTPDPMLVLATPEAALAVEAQWRF